VLNYGSNVVAIIPARNEEDRIWGVVVDCYRHAGLVVVVDDGSTDDTDARAALGGALVIRPNVGSVGKGDATRFGVDYVVERWSNQRDTTIVLLDGDGQHPPNRIPAFLGAIGSGACDMAVGSRQRDSRMPKVRRLGNGMVNLAARRWFGSPLDDIWCGFRAFPLHLWLQIRTSSRGYSSDVEMAVRGLRAGLRLGNVEVPTVYHDAEKGVRIRDGLRLLKDMWGWRRSMEYQ
jgi:glycosyltransferase involved in cell wall biosynthesis